MSGVTNLRSNPAAWLALPLLSLAVLYTLNYPSATADGYAIAATGAATISLGFVMPVVAGVSAWQAGRLRRALWWAFPWARSRALIACLAIAPSVAAGSAALLGAATANAVYLGANAPDARIVATAVSAIVSASLAGYAIGVLLPPVASAPAAVLLFYLWAAYPRALEPLWLRHLNGSFASCCPLDADIAPSALLAAFLVSTSIAVASLCVIAEPPSKTERIFGATAVVAFVALAALLVAGLGPDPVVARNRADLRCVGASIQICLWPEHERQRGFVTTAATSAVTQWAEAGLPMPSGASEAPTGRDLPIDVTRTSSRWDIVQSLGYSYVRENCAANEPDGELINAWLDATAGMPPLELTQRFGYSPAPGEVSALDALREIRRAGPDAQMRWFRTACGGPSV